MAEPADEVGEIEELNWDYSIRIPKEHHVAESRDGYWSGGPHELVAWRNAMELAKATYAAAKTWPTEERYGLTRQLRRAAVSVPANIAEGHGRFGRREFLHHLSIASGSLREVETLLEIARDAEYLSDADFSKLMTLCETTRRPLRGLFGYLKGKT
jgi:four helix bundle protein